MWNPDGCMLTSQCIMYEGNNELKLQVYAKEAVENLNVQVYWDDIEIRDINELVKVGERVRMKRYGR